MGDIVTIGGGNGSPVVNEALLTTGKVNSVNAISAVFDMGGATGRRRTDSHGQEIAFSDPMRNLASLVDTKVRSSIQYEALIKHLKSRSYGRVLGQEIFAHFHKSDDGFDYIQEHLTNLTGIKFKGKVIPSTAKSTNIIFSTTSGRIYTGENELDNHHMSKDMVKRMWLARKVPAYEGAVEAIKNAPLIILSCGSIYGSVLCNSLPTGIKDAFKKTRAKVYMVTNLVSTRNETHNFKPTDFVKLIRKYTGINPTGLIVPQLTLEEFESKEPKVARLYDLEYSYFLGWDKKELDRARKNGIKIITHDATSVIKSDDGGSLVRHNPVRLAETLKKLL